MVQAALNGNRPRSESPAIPFTNAEMTKSGREAVAAGAGCIHFHVRANDGAESLHAEDVAAALQAMRAEIPETPIGISTGEWIVRDSAERQHQVNAWNLLPDFVSVNFNEMGAAALADSLLSRGVGVEAGLGSVLAAEKFLGSGLGGRCLRVLIEPEEQELAAAIAVVVYIEGFLDRSGVKIPRLLHGHERTAWPFIDLAMGRGYDTRIGLEDALSLADGSPAPGNGAMVAEAMARTVSRKASRSTSV